MDEAGGAASGRGERSGSSADKLGFYKSKAVRKGSGKGILGRKGSASRSASADDHRRSGSTQGAPSSAKADQTAPLPPTRSVSHSVSMTLSTVNNVTARAKVGMSLDKQQAQPTAIAQAQRATVSDSGPSMSRPPVRDHAHADGDGLAQCLAACRDQGRVSGGTIGGVRVGAQHLSENLLFSSDVIKTNRRGHMQTRWIVVTTTAVYNFDSKKFRKFKRRILVPRLETLLLQVDGEGAGQPTAGTHADAESRGSHANSSAGSGVVARLTRSLSGLSSREGGHADYTGPASAPKPPSDTLLGVDEHDDKDSSMVLQVRHEYDYRLTFPSRRRRDEAVTALRYAHGQWGTTKALQVVEMSLEAIDAVMVNKSQARRHRNRTVELTGNEMQSATEDSAGHFGGGAQSDNGHAVHSALGTEVAANEASQNRSVAATAGASAASSAVSHARTATLDGLHLPSLAEQQASIDMVSLQLQQLASLVRSACSVNDMKGLKALCGRADAEIEAATTKRADADSQPDADVTAGTAEESKADVQVATDIAHSRLVADALWDDGARAELLRVMSASPQWASGRALFENVVLLLSASNPTVRHWAIKTLWMIRRLAHPNMSTQGIVASKADDASVAKPQLPEVKAELEKRGDFAQLVVQGLRQCDSDEWGAPLCRASYSALLELAIGRVKQPSEADSASVTAPVETFGRALAPDCAEALAAILELTNDKRMGQAHMSPSRSHAHEHGRLAQRDMSAHDNSHANAVHAHEMAEVKDAEELEADAPHLLQRDVLKDLNVLLLRESNFKHVLALDEQSHGHTLWQQHHGQKEGAVADSGWQRLLWPTLTKLPQKERSSVADEVLRYVLNAFASVHKYLFSTASPDRFMHTLDASFATLLALSGWWYDTVQIARTLLISIVSKVSKSVRTWRFRPHAKEWSNLWKLLNAVEDFIFYRFVQQLEAQEEAIEDRERAHPAVLRWRRHSLTWTPIAKGGQNIGIHLDPNNASCSDLDLTLRIIDLLKQLGFRPVLPADDPMNNMGNKGAEAAASAMAGGDEADKFQRENARKGAESAQAFRDYLTLFRGIEDSADAGDLASDTEIIEKVADFLQRRKRRGVNMGFFTRSKQRTMIKTLKLSMMRQQAQVRIRTATRTQHLASMQVSSVIHEAPVPARAGADDHDSADSVHRGQPGAPVMPALPDSPSAQHNSKLAQSPSQRHLLELSPGRRKELGRGVLKRASMLLAAEHDGESLEATLLDPLTGVDENAEDFDELGDEGGDGKCAVCGEFVAASESIRALGRTWHVQCFCCAGCNKPFVQLAEELEQLSMQLQATAVAKGRAIQDVQTRSPLTIGYFATSDALARLADTIASVAAGPGAAVGAPGSSMARTGNRSGSTVIPPENRAGAASSNGALTLEYYEHQGQPYCRTELVSRFGHNICAGCLEPLQRGEKVLSVLGMRWHPEHFCCSRCFEPIGADAPCFTREGRPYCKDCHEEEFDRCPACGDLLGEAEIIDALGKSWHRDHFCCDYCDKPLADASFCSAVPSESHLRKCRAYREANGLGQCLPPSYASERPYCEEHYINLFVPKCCACGEPLIDGGIDACGAVWHAECFRCTEPGCERNFPDGHFYEADIEIEYERLREEQGGVYDDDDDMEVAARQRKALRDKLSRDATQALICHPCEKDTSVEDDVPGADVATSERVKTTLTRPWCEEHYFDRFGKRCGGCKQPIRGDVFVALDQTWHAEHFVCCICSEPFSAHDLQFFPKDGKPYCEEHYVERFCERCAGCGEPIRDICASALGASWHPECLKCGCCGLLLDGKDNPVFRDAPPGSEGDGEEQKSDVSTVAAGAGDGDVVAAPPSVAPRPMCGPCWNKKYCDTCVFCGEIIRGGIDACLEALGGKWHATCFKCPVCDVALGGTPFFPHAPPPGANATEGGDKGSGEEPQQMPYCRDHYLELFCERCGGCNKPIAPEEVATCVKALGKMWHRDCLKCSATGKVFGPGDPLLQKDGKLYCKEAYDKLFSESCAVCEKPLSGAVLKALGQKFHKECFVCFECGAKPTHGREKLPTCATHARAPEAELSEAGRAKLAAARAKAKEQGS